MFSEVEVGVASENAQRRTWEEGVALQRTCLGSTGASWAGARLELSDAVASVHEPNWALADPGAVRIRCEFVDAERREAVPDRRWSCFARLRRTTSAGTRSGPLRLTPIRSRWASGWAPRFSWRGRSAGRRTGRFGRSPGTAIMSAGSPRKDGVSWSLRGGAGRSAAGL